VIGPVQVLVVGFDRPTFSGEVLAELTRLREAGIVRLVDLLLVSREEDGTLRTMPLPAGSGADLGALAAGVLGLPDGGSDADVEAADVDAIPVGGRAAVALIEHMWAAPLSAAVRRSGGTPLEETWLAPDDLELLQALIARSGRPARADSPTLAPPHD
jgi:uncharacterized membrane protein